jgi:hypothetical protein
MMNIRTDRLPDATTGGPTKIFAVLSRSVTVRGKTIRHVLIFDDHPASVRLLLGSDPAPRRRNEFLYVVLAIVLVLAAGLGMFWPSLTEHHLRRHPPAIALRLQKQARKNCKFSEMSFSESLRRNEPKSNQLTKPKPK